MLGEILDPQRFDFIARYFISGFIILSVRSRYVASQRPNAAQLLIEAVILSLLNQLVFLVLSSIVLWPFIRWCPGCQWIAGLSRAHGALFYAEVLVLPAILGLLLGLNLKQGWNRALLRRLSMPIIHPIERAYDYAFLVKRSPGFVIVTYRDGGQVFGYFGANSLASSGRDHGDLYLESLYVVDENGVWTEAEPPRSALVTLADVRSIEFLQDGGP